LGNLRGALFACAKHTQWALPMRLCVCALHLCKKR